MDRPTFSQSWSRVNQLTPKLRPHVQIARRVFKGEPWHVVHDPVNNNFFRLNPVAYHLVGLFDGRRSVDVVWRLTLERYGDASPTQHEVIGLLGQLNEANLLRIDLPPDAEPLLQRRTKRKLQLWGGQAMNVLFLRIPIFNPDRLLVWLVPLFRPILSKLGLLAWLLWMVFVCAQFLPHLGVFLGDAQSVLAPSNWGWMIVLFIVTKTCHELGHGLVCRRFGGVVPEVGIMMLVLFPVPYVDATSSWNFPSRWRRILVGAAGMIFELAVAGGAALVWLHAEPGSLTRQLSYNVVFMASVATVLFNANPLLRFDGYYILSDLLEIPNLYDRSRRHLQWFVKRFAYGMTNAQPVTSLMYESVIMFFYGIAALIYRVLILVGIVLFVAGKLLTVGILLAAWSVIAWGIVPLCKFVHWLVTGPELHEHRARAVTVTVAFVSFVLLGIGAIPAPEHYRTVGVAESAHRVNIAIQTDGFIKRVLVEAGERVTQGQVILIGENQDLLARQRELNAQIKRLLAAQREALASDPVAWKMSRAQIHVIQDELADLNQRLELLVLRSPQTGVLVGGSMKHWLGQYATRGQTVARVEDLDTLRVTALVEQAQNAALFDATNLISKIELRTAGQLTRVLPSKLIKAFPSGRMQLPHPALGYGGGGDIATRPDDPNSMTTMRPQFELWLELPREGQAPVAFPGQRVYVRFTLQRWRPLMAQWVHRARQVLRERLSI